MPVVVTPNEVSKMLRDVEARTYRKAALKGMRRGQSRLRKETREGHRKSRLGRSIFRKTKGGRKVPFVLKSLRTRRRSTGVLIAGIELVGMVAKMELGEPIGAHDIQAVKKRVLKFAADGGDAYRRRVVHPGASLRRNPEGERALRRARSYMPQIIDDATYEAALDAGFDMGR